MGHVGLQRLLSLMLKPTCVGFLSLLMFAAASSFSLAYQPTPPTSYIERSTDGRFIFVMISPLSAEREVTYWENEEWAAEIQPLRRKYTVSGLYRNDGSTEPLWTVDWYASSVVVASDGSHLIRLDLWGDVYNHPALTFISDGRKIRSYRIDELVGIPESLPYPSWLDRSQLDDASSTWSIVTHRGKYYKFDISTGEILSSFFWPPWVLGVGASLILVPLIVLLRRRSFAVHVIAMSVVSCLWTLIFLYSLPLYSFLGFSEYLSLSGPRVPDILSSVVLSTLLSLLLIGVAGIALLPAGVFWLLKRKYMPGTLRLMWAAWSLAALVYTYLSLDFYGIV